MHLCERDIFLPPVVVLSPVQQIRLGAEPQQRAHSTRAEGLQVALCSYSQYLLEWDGPPSSEDKFFGPSTL